MNLVEFIDTLKNNLDEYEEACLQPDTDGDYHEWMEWFETWFENKEDE